MTARMRDEPDIDQRFDLYTQVAGAPGRGNSDAWYVIADRVGREAKRLGGALFCLKERPEPDDENPDVDSQSESNRRIDVARTRLSDQSYCL